MARLLDFLTKCALCLKRAFHLRMTLLSRSFLLAFEPTFISINESSRCSYIISLRDDTSNHQAKLARAEHKDACHNALTDPGVGFRLCVLCDGKAINEHRHREPAVPEQHAERSAAPENSVPKSARLSQGSSPNKNTGEYARPPCSAQAWMSTDLYCRDRGMMGVRILYCLYF